MEVTVTPYKHCDLLKFGGILDGNAADDLERTLNSLVSSGKHKFVLDMSEVELLSSKGLWLLINTQKKVKRFPGGEIVLACLSPRIQNSLKLVAMDDYFKNYPTVIDAVGHF